MVEVFTTALLLLGAVFLIWASGRFNPVFGFLGGMLVLVFGVALLGSGVGYESGFVSVNSFGNVTVNESFFNNSGVFISSTIKEVPVVLNTTQTTVFNSDTGTTNQGLSLFFVLLGLLIMYLSGIDLTRPKNFVGNGVDSSNDEVR